MRMMAKLFAGGESFSPSYIKELRRKSMDLQHSSVAPGRVLEGHALAAVASLLPRTILVEDR